MYKMISADLQTGVGTASFLEWVNDHHQALQKYCRSLTGSVWEGDDLTQETWMKVWSYVQERRTDQAHISRAYLYRTARNAWIDHGRKKRPDMLSHPIELEQMEEPQCQPYEASVLRQVIELIVQKLTPEQRTVLLLIDGLKFTSKETARMLNTTEGAVKALLYRGRTKLKTTGGPQRRDEDKDKVNRPYSSDSASEVDESIVYAYIKAFREQNVAALMMLMNEGSRDVLPAVQYLHSDKLEKKKTHGKALKARSFIESMAA